MNAMDKFNQLINNYNFPTLILEDVYNRLRDCQDENYIEQQIRFLNNVIRAGKATPKN